MPVSDQSFREFMEMMGGAGFSTISVDPASRTAEFSTAAQDIDLDLCLKCDLALHTSTHCDSCTPELQRVYTK